MPVENESGLRELLELDSIAVVGASSTPDKAAHEVPAYLQCHGYGIVPVNPFAEEVLGREPYDSLADVEEEIDIVEVFRPSGEVPDIADEVLARHADRGDIEAVWLQLGIEDGEAAKRLEEVGLRVVQDHCMKIEHGMLVR